MSTSPMSHLARVFPIARWLPSYQAGWIRSGSWDSGLDSIGCASLKYRPLTPSRDGSAAMNTSESVARSTEVANGRCGMT
jgi:hypothetical protein